MSAAAAGPPMLVQQLVGWAATQPDKTAFRYLDDDGKVVAQLTYKELEARTRDIACGLLHHGAGGTKIARGDRVLLVFLPSLDFILTFLACLRAGVVAVPVYPPDPRRVRAYVTAFSATAKSAGARVALTHAPFLSAVSLSHLKSTALRFMGFGSGASAASVAEAFPDLAWQDVAKVAPGPSGAAAAAPAIDASSRGDLAFLQYTSGSTAEPKGVMISHGNLGHNLATIVRSLQAGTDTVVVSWLPQYHDMGLIGSLCGIVYCGGSGVYMSPLSFIKRPSLWIHAIATYRATHIQSPNFGFRLAARKWREAYPAQFPGGALPPPPAVGSAAAAAVVPAGVDLSCLRHMFNAAEPITGEALAEFSRTFAPYGLPTGSMKPGYGLAEHCVYVSDGGNAVLYLGKKEFERGVVSHVARRSLHEAMTQPMKPRAHPPIECVACGPVAPWATTATGVPAGTGKNEDVIVLIVDLETGAPLAQPQGVEPARFGGGGAAASGAASPTTAGGDPTVSAVASPLGSPTSPTGTGTGTGTGGEHRVGEVWIASPSVAIGYWGKPEASAETFGAKLAAPPAAADATPATAAAAAAGGVTSPAALYASYKDTPFLRTGDIGFVHRGHLFIAGRAKDMLIVRGKNYYPQDIEHAVEKMAGVRPGTTAAFQAPVRSPAAAAAAAGAAAVANTASAAAAGGAAAAPTTAAAVNGLAVAGSGGSQDGAVVVTEVRDESVSAAELEKLALAIRSAVLQDQGLALAAILLLKPHAARKTTSGKIARAHNRRAFLVMETDAASPWHASSGSVLLAWRDAGTGGEEDAEADASAGVVGAASADGGLAVPVAGASASSLVPVAGGAAAGVAGASAATAGGAATAPATAAAPRSTAAGGGVAAVGTTTTAAVAGSAAAGAGVAASSGAAAGLGGVAGVVGVGAAAGPPPMIALTGEDLMGHLQRDIAGMMRVAPAQVDPSVGLSSLGIDSLTLAQVQALLKDQYGIVIKDADMFSEGNTLHWISDNAAALRGPTPPSPPGEARPPVGDGATGGAAVATGNGGAGAAGGIAAVGVLPGGVPTVGVLHPARRQPSWFERNFPCCVCCF